MRHRIAALTLPANVTLRQGQVLLIGGQKLFQFPMKSGPVANWSVEVPNDCALVGFRVYTQAVHLFGVAAFALSNAQDVVIGY